MSTLHKKVGSSFILPHWLTHFILKYAKRLAVNKH